MNTAIKVAEYILQHGKINMTAIVKEVPDVGNYNRGAEILEDLEEAGIISAFNGHSPRKILITDINKIKELLTKSNINI